MIKDRIGQDYAGISRSRVKRTLLDKLAETHSFDVPPGMVDIEFETIWNRLQEELKRGGPDAEEAGKSEDELRAEFRTIAERRVRLGLLLSEVGRRNNIQVTQDELNRALVAEAQRYPGQEREVFEFFRNTPRAIDNIRAPLFEDKVIDFILELAKVDEKTVSVDELVRDPDEAEGTAELKVQPRLKVRPRPDPEREAVPPEFAGGPPKDQSPSRRLRRRGRQMGNGRVEKHVRFRAADEHSGADGRRADQSRRARLRHLFAPVEGAHHLHDRAGE